MNRKQFMQMIGISPLINLFGVKDNTKDYLHSDEKWYLQDEFNGLFFDTDDVVAGGQNSPNKIKFEINTLYDKDGEVVWTR